MTEQRNKKRVGKMRPPLENIDELYNRHSRRLDLWESSEKVAKRLDKSRFNDLKHWWALTRVPENNPSVQVWKNFSIFLESCDEEIFEKFLNKIQFTKVDLGEFLKILHENNSNGEEIFAFFYNISPILGRRQNQKIKEATKLIEQKLASDPDTNLVEIGEIYNLVQRDKGNNFLTYQQWQDHFKELNC